MAETANKTRLEYIDVVKAISIMMIMMGHIATLPKPLNIWMSSVKITAFYVISGFLMAYTRALHKRTPVQFTKHILQTLAWPYLTFSIAAVIAKCFFVYSKHFDKGLMIEKGLQTFKDALFLKGIHGLWFLPTLFFGELIILLLFHLPKVFSLLYACAAPFVFRLSVPMTAAVEASGYSELGSEFLKDIILALSKSISAAWFIGFGYLLYLAFKKIDILRGHYAAKFCVGTVLTALNVFVAMHNNGVNFNCMMYGTMPVCFFFGGTIGVIGLILLADAAASAVSLRCVGYWGRNSLILMCTHVPFGFRSIALTGWDKVSMIPDFVGLDYYIQCFCVLAVLLLIMGGLCELINNHLPFMTKFPKKQSKKTA